MRLTQSLAMLTILLLLATPAAFAETETLHEQRSFTAKVGAKVEVDVSFHDVVVRVHEGDTVDITVDMEISASARKARRLIEEYAPVFDDSNTRIRVRSVREGVSWSWGSSRMRGKVEVLMPSGLDLVVDTSSGSCRLDGDLGDSAVVLDTSSGEVDVDGAMRELLADTSSGSVTVRLSRRAESVEADTSSGDVRVNGPVQTITANTSSGSVDLNGLLGDADLDTSSGDVTAGWDSIGPGCRVSANTSSGGVRLTLPAGTVLDGSVDTGSGRISSDFPGESSDKGHHLDLRGGAGAVRINVDTSSGGAKLIAR